MKPIALVAILLIALAGGGYYLFFETGKPDTADPSGGQPAISSVPDAAGPSAPIQRKDPVGGERTDRDTTGGKVRVTDTEQPKLHPQGIQGRIQSSTGSAIQGAEVFLLHGVAAQDMISQLAALGAKGRMVPKIAAKTESKAGGAFKLGAPPTRGDANFELRVKAQGHVVYQRQLRVVEDRFEDLGTIRLERGRQVQGIVRDKVTRAPIADATVRVRIASANFLVPTPGLEEGLEAVSDKSGRYEVSGLPVGPMELTAFGRGYGTFSKTDLLFEQNEQMRTIDIELPKGFSIEGWVTDAEGNPIPKARVEAVPFSASLPAGHAYSDSDGRYAVHGLGEGDYIVGAEVRGFVRNERKPIPAGSKEIMITLDPQGAIRIKVTSKSGRAVQRYRVELKRFYPENPEHLARSDVPPVEVRSPRGGEFVLRGVNPGHYVLQIDTVQFAKTYSKNFQIAEGQTEPVLVEVLMNEGATIYGTVTDRGGMAVTGASVATVEDSYQDNPLIKMFRPLMTVKVTERTVVTDNKGRFRLDKLNPAKYQLVIDHPEYTRTYKKGFEVADGQKLDTGLIRLPSGGRVYGTVFGTDGRPVPAAKVTVTSVASGTDNPQVYEQVFADQEGNFKVGRLLPEGRYEVQASRTDHANPLMQLADIQRSRTEIQVQRNMPKVIVRIKAQ